MISAIIIDDEKNNRQVLRTLLEKHCPDVQVTGEASGADAGFLLINRVRPMLVLLDIHMPKKSGFDLLKRFPKIDFEVIFITAYDEYAIRAFEFNAVGYILKPVEAKKLVTAITAAVERLKAKSSPEPVMHFIHTLSEKNELLHKFSLHHNDNVVFVPVSDISFIMAQGHSTMLCLHNNIQYHSSKELLKFEQVLQGSDHFIRINKSIIININHIRSYSKGEPCFITMQSGESFEVSRRRKADILKRLSFL